ncbi:hypothetical protein SKP52_24645 (plasmid) [Sphingopyxis fribergensis]|uniref:SRPBCC domain-containing protein n=1 Tax=Sphingopyxis fribergensis TaxID=1515612 RepID=A0A0A7PNV4_9SPHN|nr:SRPBCC domain-containing protein [Sphingopyxis fribergensis]AJA11766.1 hypothetical protein SKP52_24645 [Sphingopyxis fribergensis]
MFEVTQETHIARSPAQVWDVLANFERYEQWSPYVRPKGSPEQGKEIDYSFRMNPANPRFWPVTAIVSEWEPCAKLGFDVRLNWMLTIEERFVLEPAAGGTRLVHSFRCRGLLARLRLSKARRNFKEILNETDRLLTRYLSRPANKPVLSAKPKRKGRR